ncbi:MAG: hypothetical protein R3F13_11155 [Prosthecobacter sp.]
MRRALEHGFTAAEFEEAKATILKSAKLRASQAESRKSRDLASGIVSVLAAKKVFTLTPPIWSASPPFLKV